MKKSKHIGKILSTLTVATPLAATAIACGADSIPDTPDVPGIPNPDLNQRLDEAANWLEKLYWTYNDQGVELTQQTFDHQWFESKEIGHPLNNFNFDNITAIIPYQGLTLLPSSGVVEVTYKLSNGLKTKTVSQKMFTGWKNTTVFNQDISGKTISDSTFKDVNVWSVSKWPTNLNNINWTGVKGLTSVNTPFKGDISATGTNLTITNNTLNGIDVSRVTKWPEDLTGVDWTGVIGLTSDNTPFTGDLTSGATKHIVSGSTFNGIDLSQVKTWPEDLSQIDWSGVTGLTSENTPFKGDISSTGTNLTITGSILNGVDLSGVKKWPTDLSGIDWTGAIKLGQEGGTTPFVGDISNLTIRASILNGVDVSGVKKWPTDLKNIDWTEIKGLTVLNTPFNGAAFGKSQISGSILNGIDLSKVSTWPKDLSNINWTNSQGLTSNNSPFQQNISNLTITGSHLNGVDLSIVQIWPTDLSGIDWTGIIGLTTNTPFKEDISESTPEKPNINSKTITGSVLNGVDVSGVTTWPTDLTGINWTGVVNLEKSTGNPFKGDLSAFNIFGTNLNLKTILTGVDVSGVLTNSWVKPKTTEPTGPSLNYIDWTGVKGLDKSTPFTDTILATTNIIGNTLTGVDVSQVITWPENLSEINWTDATGLTTTNTPFKADISSTGTNLAIAGSTLSGVNISTVTTWPTNVSGIDWTDALWNNRINF